MYRLLNEHGNIPRNTICPYHKICTRYDGRCSGGETYEFSCGLARGFDRCYDELFSTPECIIMKQKGEK